MRPFRFDQPILTDRLVLRPIRPGDLDVRNTGSSALCARLGMRLEAHDLQDTLFKGHWIDTLTYAVLATEWSSPAGGQFASPKPPDAGTRTTQPEGLT